MSNPALKLEDFSDRELLWALEESADPDGFVSSSDLAGALGMSSLENPTRNVAVRLGWLKRYGIVERHDDGVRWGLTSAGAALLNARLDAAEAKALDGLDPDKLLVVMQRVGHTMAYAGKEAATMAQRDFRNAQATRKRRLAAA
jgi:hypothetical protein